MKKHRMPAIMLALTFILAGGNANKVGSSTGEIPETGVEETSADTGTTERGEKTVTFAYAAFKYQIEAMADVSDGTFRYADNERDGNLYFLEQEGGTHSGKYAMEYFYNGLLWIWQS